MDVYLNGRMIPYGEARVAHDDASIQHAVGLFETMTACHGRVFRLEAHLDRLGRSAAELGLVGGFDRDRLAGAVTQTLTHNSLDQARVRLTVTPGSVSLLRTDTDTDTVPEPTVLVVATDRVEYDPAYFEKGVTVIVGGQLANPFDPTAGHKTVAYWSRLSLLRRAASMRASEAIVLTISNHLAGGAVSNIFLVKDGGLMTPIARGEEKAGAVPAPVLPGITRAAIFELAEAEAIDVKRRMLAIDDLLDADEVFLTNCGWQVLPVTNVEKKKIADGKVGPVTAKLRQGLLDLIDRETGKTDG